MISQTLKLRKKKLTTSSIKSSSPVVGSVTSAKKSVTIIDGDHKKTTNEGEEKRSRLEKAGIKFIKY